MKAEDARAELTVLFEEWLARLGEEDPSFYERVLDEDWVYTDITGSVRGKREYLRYIGTISANISSRLVELEARVYGDVALVIGRYEIEGALADGTDVSSATRFTAVWRSTDDGWRALAHHATRIAEP